MNHFDRNRRLKKRNTRALRRSIVALCTLAAIIISLVLSGIDSLDSAASGNEFEVSLSANMQQTKDSFEVVADIKNNGGDFSGKLRVILRSSSYAKIGYDVDVSLPAGQSKAYSVYIPVQGVDLQEKVTVAILDKKEKSVYTGEFRNVFLQYSAVINAAYLSDNPDSLKFMDLSGYKVNISNQDYGIKLSEINATDIHDDIRTYNMIIIDDYDTSTLSREAIELLQSYVNEGGVLLLGTGDKSSSVLSGFDDDFLMVNELNSYEWSGIVGEETTTVQEFDYLVDYSYAGNYCYSRNLNQGVLAISQVKFADYAGSENAQNFLSEIYSYILSSVGTSGGSSGYSDSYYLLKNVQGYMEKPANTGSIAIFILITIYVVLVGPVIYLILKSIKKRERIWLVIPCISLLFVGIIFLLSFGIRVNGLTLKSITVDNTVNGRSDAYLLGYSADPKSWNVRTKKSYDTGWMIGNYSSKSGNTISVDGALKKTSSAYDMTFYPDSTFDTAMFVLEDRKGKTEGIELDRSDYDSSITRVTNNTGVKFDYMYIASENGYQLVENVANGESVNVSLGQNFGYQVYNSFTSGDTLLEYIAGKDYKDGKYDKASAIAAMAIAVDRGASYTTGSIVVGVVKTDSLTDKNEKSYKCYLAY